MSKQGQWDIRTDGVSSVVSRTSDVARHLKGEAKSYAGHLENAAKYAGTLSQGGQQGSGAAIGLVGLALSQFGEATQKSLDFLAERTGKALQGTVDATKHYVHGDLDMAAEAQANAVKDPGPPAAALPKQDKK